MAAAVENPPQPEKTETAPSVPDYMLDPDAVTRDNVTWRQAPPNYSKTRAVYQASQSPTKSKSSEVKHTLIAESSRTAKRSSHAPGSLESMVENLVKNWEIEASHKIRVSDWRTVDPDKYTFAINGGEPQDAEHMLKVGTYNAIIAAPNQYYDATFSDFEKSHKTFREMMPVFTWEVLEVYSPPPTVAFKWRHWGEMKADYVGWNNKGEKVTLKATDGSLDIQGVTVAKLNDKFQVTSLETWFDPLDMFHQMVPKAVEPANSGGGTEAAKPSEEEEDGKAPPSLIDQPGGQENGTTSATQTSVKPIEGSELTAGSEQVKLINPSIPTNGHHGEGQEHSETREAEGDEGGQGEQTAKKARVMELEDATVSTGGIVSCPFLNGQQSG